MEDMFTRLTMAGVEVVRSTERFAGNKALYERFLKKFPDDRNYNLLQQAVLEQDYEHALIYAHTLKGVSANLGMSTLCDLCAQLVACFRSNELEKLDELIKSIQQCYDQMITAIVDHN